MSRAPVASDAEVDAAAGRWARSLAWGALMLVAFARAAVSFEPFPYWDMDPSVVYVPMTGIGPAGSMLLDVASLLAAALALAMGGRCRRVATVWCVCLWIVGAAGVSLHAVSGPGLSLDDLRVGSAWAASLAVGIAIWRVCGDERTARLTVAIAAGFVGMLAVKGAVQVFLEHPLTVDEFERSRETILAARGWPPDSAMARGFERRLRQPEATGWFGLANVYATFAAGAFIVLCALAAVGWKASRQPRQEVSDGVAGIAAVGALGAGAALWMAGSKAGFGVAIVGAALLGLRVLVRRFAGGSAPLAGLLRQRPRLFGGAGALTVVASALVALLAQGIVGERAGNLSLLFRWFYLVGAGRIVAEHPFMGVGPSGFQQAFLLAKPPLCPESVESPHSLFFDYVAALGVLGMAWCGLIGWWVWSAGAQLLNLPRDRALSSPGDSATSPPGGGGAWKRDLRPIVWVVLLTALASAWLPTVLAAWIERGAAARFLRNPAATPDWALTLVLGGAAWIALAGAAASITRVTGTARTASAAAAIALALHAQMEMTPIQPGSAALFMLFLGAGAAGLVPASKTSRGVESLARFAWVPFVAAALASAVGAAPRVLRWESALAAAAADLHPIAEVWSRLNRLQADPDAAARVGDSLDKVRADLADALGLAGSVQGLDPLVALTLWKEAKADRVHDHLYGAALRAFPSHGRTRAASVNWMLSVAESARRLGHDENARDWLYRAGMIARRGTELPDADAAVWNLLANVHTAHFRLLGGDEHARFAAAAWGRAAALDPYGVAPAHRLTLALAELGRADEAATWARKTLALNENLRLDPLVQLTPAQRSRLESLARPLLPPLP